MKNESLISYLEGNERKTYRRLTVAPSWTLPYHQKELIETVLIPLRKVGR
jgi:hypothetical protein